MQLACCRPAQLEFVRNQEKRSAGTWNNAASFLACDLLIARFPLTTSEAMPRERRRRLAALPPESSHRWLTVPCQAIARVSRSPRDGSPEVIDPHAGIHQYQWPVIIASRSPRHSNLPRRGRIADCLFRRSKVCNASSTASRLVFKPVALRASRMSLSSNGFGP